MRSVGISRKSKYPISRDDIGWADLILAMQGLHRSRILGLSGDLSLPKIENLDIPDEYDYVHGELNDIFRKSVELYINALEA